MQEVLSALGNLFSLVPFVVLLLAVALSAGVGVYAHRYQKVAPDEVLVISGRKHRIRAADGSVQEIGSRIVKGGGTFVWPVVEKVNKLSLSVITLDVNVEDAYTVEGVPVNVDSVVVMKIGGDDISIANAAERFLSLSPTEIRRAAQEVLGGYLRSICSTLTPEAINKDRISFQQKVLDEAHQGLGQMGLRIDSFTIRKISDRQGYFDALGKTSTAGVIRDARIGEANALARDAVQQESLARKDGETTRAGADAAIAEAVKDRDVRIAQYAANVATEKARADQAGPLAEAEARQAVTGAQTLLATKEAERKQQELLASTVRPAEAERDAAIARAEGERQATILQAEGVGQQSKEVGFAHAEVIQKTGEAEGQAIEARLVAEANGLAAKADAMGKFNDASMRLQVAMELIHVLPELVRAAASPIAGIDSLKIVDLGGNHAGGNGTGPIDKLLQVSPQTLATLNEVLVNTVGMDLPGLLSVVRSGVAPAGTPASEAPTEG